MRQAIIDIGSNAIRAVVYASNELGANEIYNEKFKTDLIGLLEEDDLDIRHGLYLVIQHFVHVFSQLRVENVKCVATAVLRNCNNAYRFVELIKHKYNIEIEIISGSREAYLTASGLMLGVTDASGLAADLGGGSLELAEIANKEVGSLQSFALGTSLLSPDVTVESIKESLLVSFKPKQYDNLYLIGGAFRMLGRAYMKFSRYPLKNLHNLKIGKDELLMFFAKSEALCKNNGYSYLYPIDLKALTVTKALIELFDVSAVIISNYGLKEGVRFINLSQEERVKDILYERCKHLVNFDSKNCDLQSYYDLMRPLLLDSTEDLRQVIDLTIILTCFNNHIDKTMRANMMADFILASDIPFSHQHRVMIAVALSYIFSSKADTYLTKLAKRLLSREDYANSQIIGNVIRIAHEVDGPDLSRPSFGLLLKDDRYIEITSCDILPRIIFEKVCERLKDVGIARKNFKYGEMGL